MSKTLVYTAPNRLIAEGYAAELLDAGIPVKVEFTTGFGETHPLGPAELWVDDEFLEDPEVSAKITEVFEAVPLTDEDADSIGQMRFVDVVPKKARSKQKRLLSCLLLVATLVATPACFYLIFWLITTFPQVLGTIAVAALLVWLAYYSVNKLRLE